MTGAQNMTLEDIRSLAFRALAANGCGDAQAGAVADTVTRAEADGCASHGLFRIPGYIKTLVSGKVDGNAEPVVDRAAPSSVRVDGAQGFAPLAQARGLPILIEAARETGVAAMGLVRVHHFSALWNEVEPLCDAGLIGFAFTAYKPVVAPAGSAKPLYGTNPMSFGWPRADGRHMIFDQASAAMARGEIMIAARDGHQLPPGAGLGPEGEETTDPNLVLKGVQLPFGGYKGSNIAMMVELLAAGLIGEGFSYEAEEYDNNDGGPPRGGEFMLALDPARMGDAAGWQAHGEAFFEHFGALGGTRLPSSRRYDNRARTAREGAAVNPQLVKDIEALIS
ncbi:MAG: Ldh family oxidoreductase [Rhodospirillales bacterium]